MRHVGESQQLTQPCAFRPWGAVGGRGGACRRSQVGRTGRKPLGTLTGAKGVVDDRFPPEARRLLWHTDPPTAAVGDRRGLLDPGVITRLFRRRIGEIPAVFRHGPAA